MPHNPTPLSNPLPDNFGVTLKVTNWNRMADLDYKVGLESPDVTARDSPTS